MTTPPEPTDLELAKLASQLLPYTDHPIEDAHGSFGEHTCAFDARAAQAADYAFRLFQAARLDRIRRRIERNALPPEKQSLRLQIIRKAGRRSKFSEEEFFELILEGNRSDLKTKLQCWKEFINKEAEPSFGNSPLEYTLDTAVEFGLTFKKWFEANVGRIYKANLRASKKKAASKGGKAKHKRTTELHGEAVLSGDSGDKFDEAIKRLPKTSK